MSLDQSCNFEQLSKDEILNSDFLTNIFDTDDDVLFYTYFNALEDRAQELKCLTQFKRIAKAFEKEHKKIQKAKILSQRLKTSQTFLPDWLLTLII